MTFIGQSLRRFEDQRFLTGRGRYVADMEVPGALWLGVVRSPHAHARIVSITAAGITILTARDIPGHLPCPANLSKLDCLLLTLRPGQAS